MNYCSYCKVDTDIYVHVNSCLVLQKDRAIRKDSRQCVLCGAKTESFQDQACNDCYSDHRMKLEIMRQLENDISDSNTAFVNDSHGHKLADNLIRKGWRKCQQ